MLVEDKPHRLRSMHSSEPSIYLPSSKLSVETGRATDYDSKYALYKHKAQHQCFFMLLYYSSLPGA